MTRVVSWGIIVLAILGVASLAGLPLAAGMAAKHIDFPRPDELPEKPHLPDQHEEPLISVEELHKALRLPRVDPSPSDGYSQASLAAYEAGDYEKAFENAILALDPTPIEKNELYRILTTSQYSFGNGGPPPEIVEKPNGRLALKTLDEVLRPIVNEEDPQTAARLSNASAMLTLYLYAEDESPPGDQIPMDHWMAKELAHQAASLRPAYCSALLNLTLFDGMVHHRLDDLGRAPDLDYAGGAGSLTGLGDPKPGTEYYSVESCDDPALLYYRTENSIRELQIRELEFNLQPAEIERKSSTLRLAERLERDPRWAGLAHSLKGDFYYWAGATFFGSRPFAQRRYLKQALWEYDAALALQPDDPGIRHGRAMVYLEFGRAEVKDEVDTGYVDRAIDEAEAALKVAQVPSLPTQTLARAHEEKGEHQIAARLERDLLANERPIPAPLSLVTYTPISHGADKYSEFRFFETAGGGSFSDEEIIEPFEPKPYDTEANWSAIGGLEEHRNQLRYYTLLRNDLLSGDHDALRADLEFAPAVVRGNERTVLVVAIEELLTQPADTATPTTETQSAIDGYVIAYVNYPNSPPIDKDMLKNRRIFGERVYLKDYLSPLLDKLDSVEPDDGSRFPQNGFFYWEAANFLRQHKQYEKAIRVYDAWLAELERDEATEGRQAVVHNLLGEAHFLAEEQREEKDYVEALDHFEQAAELHPGFPPYLTRQAFMYEQRGDYGEAEASYRDSLEAMHRKADWMPPDELEMQPPFAFYFPDNYQVQKHLGDVLMRQVASAERTEDDAEGIRASYMEAAAAYRYALGTALVQETYGTSISVTSAPAETPSAPAAVNNLGVALLKAGKYEHGVEVLETLVRPPIAPDDEEERVRERAEVFETLAVPYSVSEQWKTAYIPDLPSSDDQNPVFHLNLGWAYELNNAPKKAKAQYLLAVKSDPSFYPALNDLGVMAAKDGRMEEAKSYFAEALREEPDYAHAAYNIGVALLHSGPRDFLASQGYLGRAVREDPSLSESSYYYVSDHELYFLNLSLAGRVSPDWEFAKDAENGMGMVAPLVLILLLGRIAFGYVGSEIQDAVIERSFSEAGKFGSTVRLPRLLRRLRDSLVRFINLGVSFTSGWWMTLVALLVSVPAIVAVVGWSLLWENSQAKLSMLATLFYLAMVLLFVHHAGHALVALGFRMRVLATLWPAGIAQSLALVIIGGPAIVPMPANFIEGSEGRGRERSLIFLAGPAANIVLAVLLFVLFLVSSIPLLRFGAILNLSAAAVSLLLLPPLDGAMVTGKRYARLLFWLGLALAAASVAVYFSNELYCQQSPGESCWGLDL